MNLLKNINKDKIKNTNTNKSNISDIESLYNIKTIYEDYYINNENKIVIMFEIDPIVITNLTKDIEELIYTIYSEFLKSINNDFKIYIKNDNYKVKQIKEENNSFKSELKNEYINNLKFLIKENDVFLKKYYIIITTNDLKEIKDVEKQIYTLNNIGLNVKRISNINKIKELIKESVNR